MVVSVGGDSEGGGLPTPLSAVASLGVWVGTGAAWKCACPGGVRRAVTKIGGCNENDEAISAGPSQFQGNETIRRRSSRRCQARSYLAGFRGAFLAQSRSLAMPSPTGTTP